MRWLAMRSVVGQILALGAAVVLARLVTPAQFGHAAVALLFTLVAVVLTFEGFAGALVQQAEVNERHRQVAVLMNLAAGTVLGAAVLLMVPFVWRPIFGSQTAALIALASPSFLIASVGTVSRAMLLRRLDFRQVTKIDLLGALGGNVTAVVMAVFHLGAVAIVGGSMAGIALGSVLMLLAVPEPWPRWHRQEARDVIGYGGPSALAGLVSQMFSNVDYWILAARLTAYQTGIYYRAFNVGVVYQSKISNVMMEMAFPVYSRLESRDEMRRLHERAARIHAVAIFPLLALLAVLAPIAIPFVFGSQWRPAVKPTEIMAVAGMFAAILVGYSQVMQAVGRTRALMRFNVIMLLTYAGTIFLASTHGLVVVAIAVAAFYAAVLAAAYQFLLKPSIGLSISRLIPELGPAVIGCAALVAVCDPLRVILAPQLPAPVTLSLIGVIGLVIYGSVLRVLFRQAWRDFADLVVRVVPRISRVMGPRGAARAAEVSG
jgi:lipopolysaccharide exporter